MKTKVEALRVVGQPVSRKDGKDIVTGNVLYGVDMSLPGMLHGRVVRSAVASGKVVRIDDAAARALSGVRAVITAADVPATRFGYGIKDEQIFAAEKIRYAGEAIAAVAALDEESAEEAAGLVQVEYEETAGVFDVLEAAKKNAPLVHTELGDYEPNRLVTREWNPSPGTNVLHHIEMSRGDVETGFREADHVFEDTFRTRRVHHGYLEPHGCAAKVEGGGGKITVWTSTQRVFIVRAMLADVFGVPEASVRVICTKVGGGFGGKNGVRLEHYAVALAMKTGRPVKMVMRRDEEFTASAGSVPAVVVMKTGVKRDGRMTAREVKFLWDCGAYSDGLPASNRAIKDGAGPYKLPHLKVTSSLVYTNTMRGCPFRGLGVPEAIWAGESQIDMIARRLGIDPVDFRMQNLIEDGDPAPTGEIQENVTARECLQRVVDASGYKRQKNKSDGRAVGVSMIYKSPTGAGGGSSAVVTLNRDGSVHLIIGSTDVGGGMETVLAQLAAEEFAVSIDDVTVLSADTSVVPFDYGTYSSRVLVSSGLAVLQAAAEARREFLETAGMVLGEEPSTLILREKKIFPRAGGKPVPIEEILRDPRCRQKNFTGGGAAAEDGKKGGWSFGAQAVEIEIDRETGEVRVLKVVSAHDLGKAINPPLAVGQVEGGVVMGLGYALREELRLDEGRIINPSFADYAIPFAEQTPPIETILIESPSPVGPFGAKGIGELALFGIAPAIANALDNAVGKRLTELPLSPENVLKALETEQNA
ncbi:MAG TPA: xanthine dehydrogenase family protein molybdopterin-binding subunit [Candidatus Binatia bacterium]